VVRVALACTVALAALGALAATAGAIISGPNGPIVFTSGRGGAPGDDNNAKIYVANGPGAAIQVTTGATRHSHPAWSPDRTRIAYSKSVSGAGARDIWIKDLITGADLQVTDTTTADEDRAAWSPDGTKLAYGVRAAADPSGATEQADIMIDSNLAAAGGGTPFANVADDSEDRPAWSPDGQFIYYARDENTPYNDDNDIVRKPVGGGSVDTIVAQSPGPVNEWQPALSPDGTKVCYSRGGMLDTTVDVYTANTNGLNSNITMFKTSSTKGEFNCVWSPDGKRIGYTFGVFSGGDLLTAPSDGSFGTSTIADSPMHFDGNSDWTYNPLPTCSDGAASVAFNSFVSIPLSCTDAIEPTDTEPQDVDEEIVAGPAHGNLGALQGATVIYTPTANFQGQDSLTFTGTNFGFGGELATSNVATVSVTVAGPGGGGGGATVEALTMSPKRWRRGSALPTVSAAPVGTRIGVRLSAAGRVKLKFKRARPGRRVRGRCVKPTAKNRNRRRCTRYVTVRPSLFFNGKQGANSVRFQGRLNRRKRLPIGRYRLFATVTAGGKTSAALRVSFRIVRR